MSASDSSSSSSGSGRTETVVAKSGSAVGSTVGPPVATGPIGRMLDTSDGDLFLHTLQWADTCDLGALAAVSTSCRRLAINHIRRVPVLTLHVRGDTYDGGVLVPDPLRSCSIRGVRLLALHLPAVGPHIGQAVQELPSGQVLAHVVPLLTSLQRLHICGSLLRAGQIVPKVHPPPSLTCLEVENAEFDTVLPEIVGGAVTHLTIRNYYSRLGDRIVRPLCSTLRALDLSQAISYLGQPYRGLLLRPITYSRVDTLRLHDAVDSHTLANFLRACPALTVVDAPVASAFRVRDLATFLVAAQTRLHHLRLSYSKNSEQKCMMEPARVVNARGDVRGRLYEDEEDAKAIELMAPVVMSHLVSLKVDMCCSALLRKLHCPQLERLELLGARVHLHDIAPLPAAFPRLETLSLRVSATAIPVELVDAKERHDRLTSLVLQWDECANRKLDDKWSGGACEFRPAVLAHIIDRCPALTSLRFGDHTPAAAILAALAEPRSLPSRIRDISVRMELAASPDELLRGLVAIRANHPNLQCLDVPCSAALDPGVAAALSGS